MPQSQQPAEDDAWQRFLALLSPDARLASTSFEALRRRLVDVFRWRGLASADELADETIERAVRRVAAGDEIRNLVGYVCGIAHKLALEAARRESKIAPLDADAAPSAPAAEAEAGPDRERLASLDQCLDRLPPMTRRLLLQYYADGRARIEQRRLLADELGIGLNALRIRVHRLRTTLETCLDGGARSPRHARGTSRPRSELA